ncbi:unnamed protein product [Rotaria sp. Silwood1]|nr:unnamed protein product [Rotaria sp. Silwood1]
MLIRQGATRFIEAEFHRLANIDISFPDHTTIHSVVCCPTEFILAEKTVATLLSKTLEQAPKYSESQALKIISTFLEGHAKQWFNENITIFESWSVFKAEFIHTYSSPAAKQLAFNRLRTRQQRYDEAVIEYYTDVMKLCKLVDSNMTDASKLDHLYRGLKSSLMKEVLRQAPSTPSEFFEQARCEENLERLVTTSVHQTNDNDTQAINYSNNSLYRPTQSTESMHYQNSPNIYSGGYSTNVYSPRSPYNRFHHRSSPRHPSQTQQSSFNALRYQLRPLRCYLCQKLGHFARDCRSAKNY